MDFKLPEIGEGLQEGELVQWLVKAGDTVEADQPLVEVMTDKATVEVPATDPGVIKELLAKDGDMIKVGQVIATIDRRTDENAEKSTSKEAKTEEKAPTQSPASNGNGKGYGIFADEEETPAAKQETPAYQGAQEQLVPSSVPAAPIVRSMASKAGVDLANVSGTGPSVGGVPRILEADLLKFLNSQNATSTHAPAAASSAVTPTPAPTKSVPTSTTHIGDTNEEVERVPLRGLRRVIANAMTKSKFTAPHYSYVDEFECSDLIQLRKQAKEIAAQYGVSFSYLPFIIKAVVGALKEYPIANSSLEEEKDGSSTLVYKKFFHIGFAVATNDGLIVPVIKHADQKTMLQIAQEINELAEKTRTGKATADELKGSTFTITSMGNLGGRFATPIINYPEVGILGVYKAQEKPIVKNGEIVIGNMMPLSLSLDHRVVDGAVGSKFCTAIIDRLKNPAKMLMELV
ncbi:2-oxo acid dehydrogenase subunit E2 [bacterium]|nr:2-oxo acid dehydrogenase subunit E2 [bacterium]